MTSPYLLRPLRTEAQFRAQRLENHARLAELHACLDRAGLEARRIANEHSLDSGVADAFYSLADMLDDPKRELRHDYLKPAEEELRDAGKVRRAG